MKEQLKNYIEEMYGDVKEHDKPMYAPEILQSRRDFKAGFEAGKPKYIKGVPLHNNEVIVKLQRSHHGTKDKTEIKQFAFYENDVWQNMDKDNIEDHDWQVIEYVEIP